MTLKSEAGHWCTGPEYQQDCPWLTGDKFMQVTDLLLENPNLNSTHLFRADIFHDSAAILQTVHDRERQCRLTNGESEALASHEHEFPQVDVDAQAPRLEGAILKRRVLRRLIPRKPQLDRALDQWCFIYHCYQRLAEAGAGDEVENPETLASSGSDIIVVYAPLVNCEADMPWYHPPVQALAYFYQHTGTGTDNNATATLSVHFLPFDSSKTNTDTTGPTPTITDALPPRLHRTFISLLRTFLRLAKNPAPEKHGPKPEPDGSVSVSIPLSAVDASLAPSALKDTILPQHVVQNTYTRLKQQYAPGLISRWVESTEPSKHVFEDLSIAAFVIELWKQMYPDTTTGQKFPGFVDLACGNGVLTYILIKEGYRGRGFDARRRKTWQVLGIDEYLDEMICIPEPFLECHNNPVSNTNDNGSDSTAAANDLLSNTEIHNGIFEPGTFIISNHADELTPWTPLLAALSDPQSPLPFLSIPCCSHALSGAKHRYWPSEIRLLPDSRSSPGTGTLRSDGDGEAESQPVTGDLKALRAAKVKAANHTDDKSMYACLTRKTVALAEEVGFDVELTLMRIPSTRNIGIVGNRRRAAAATAPTPLPPSSSETDDAGVYALRSKIHALLERECAMSGGVGEAAKTWIERAQKLQGGVGRGKVNLGGRQPAAVD